MLVWGGCFLDGESERERERESGGDEEDESATKRRKRERNSFVVESKTFEIDAEEKRGKIQVAIWEKKKGISSWVRLGSASLGFLLESLDHCIKDGKGGKWERDGKKMGDPTPWGKKGMGDHGGETTANGRFHGRKEHKQSEWGGGKLVLERSYAEVVKRQKNRDKNLVRMDRRRGPGDLGRSLAKIWGLKGNLGMARLEENKVLLEFELMEKHLGNVLWEMIDWASIIAMEPEHFEKSGGGVWRIYSNGPSDGKTAGASMGSDIDQNRGGRPAKVLEIAVEEKVYSLALWWELKPALRKAQENRREEYERTRGEVRGDGGSRADTRVEKELENLGSRSVPSWAEAGPSRKWWTAEEESPSRDGEMDLDDSPTKQHGGRNFKYWVTEDVRKQNMKILHSATDSTLVEEALRGSITIVQDLLGRGLSLRFPCVFYREMNRGERKRCWDLVETNGGSDKLGGGSDVYPGNKNPTNVEGVVRSLGSGRFLDWRALDASGTAGGILICWDKRTLEILDWEEGQFSLSCRFRNVENGTVWVFTGVYGPFTKEERECLWEEIGAIRGLWEDPWCVGGDYNITLFQRERSRQGRITSAMRRFAQIWLDQFSGVLQRRLPRPLSDHFPVLLEGGGLRRGPSPFRFENMWLKEVFRNLGCNKAAALQQVEFWDLVESDRILSVEETELKKRPRKTIKNGSFGRNSLETIIKGDLAKEGDRNTGYFHRMANANRRNNYLDRIKIDGVCLSEEQEVREGIANAYQQMLSEGRGGRLTLGALMEMNGDKAPGPDGFTVAFWQSCWGFVKEEILAMFKEFHEQNTFLKSLNNTFLVLIPKKVLNEGSTKMGFGPKWLRWMWSCISSAKFSILVNGVPTGFFPSSKGLRQGDPLSPYLFVMGMEVLGFLLGGC
ncbi:hypothetical protein CK203_045021 [Vitis vinifera]|uniref:Uncharacterized protein n=1 Tax=Vitis vinifera TaxID=29760 RepID=A0A438HWN4_VITVI|nr:hypothetical protein CK203_045021 [Vitis vinifera]